MTAPAAQTKSNALLSDLDELTLRPSVDRFTLNKIRMEVNALKKVDIVYGALLQSALYVLEKNYQGAWEESRKLISQWPGHDDVLYNALITLNRIGRITEQAVSVMQAVLTYRQGDFTTLQLAYISALVSGYLSESKPLLVQIQHINPDFDAQEFYTMLESFSQHGVKDTHTTPIAELAYASLRDYENGMFIGRTIYAMPEVITDEWGEVYMANRVYIPMRDESEIEHISKLNDMVCVGLADAAFIGNPALNRFVVDFVLEDMDT